MSFEFGTCTVPCGKLGPWKISEFTVDDKQAFSHNFANIRHPGQWIKPGTYKKLTHAERGVIMSNTPMEVNSNWHAFARSKGRVLVNGLGLGMLLEGILSKPAVAYARVIEIDAQVIKLVGPHFANDPRVEIIHADALTYKPARGETFDYAWHDIWDSISWENLSDMATLGRRYNKRVAAAQGWWARDTCRELNR